MSKEDELFDASIEISFFFRASPSCHLLRVSLKLPLTKIPSQVKDRLLNS